MTLIKTVNKKHVRKVTFINVFIGVLFLTNVAVKILKKNIFCKVDKLSKT